MTASRQITEGHIGPTRLMPYDLSELPHHNLVSEEPCLAARAGMPGWACPQVPADNAHEPRCDRFKCATHILYLRDRIALGGIDRCRPHGLEPRAVLRERYRDFTREEDPRELVLQEPA